MSPRLAVSAASLAFALVASCENTGGPPDSAAQSLIVFAPASLAVVMQSAADSFRRSTGRRVDINQAATSVLAHQLEAGAPCDLFISADPAVTAKLTGDRFLDPARPVELAENRLVVICRQGLATPIRFEPSFDFAGVVRGRLAVGDPSHVPQGIYARQALTKLGWWPAFESRLAPTPNATATVRMVAGGECDWGIVYATDAAGASGIVVAAEIPPSLHDRIHYLACLTSQARPGAHELLTFLRGRETAQALRAAGFRTAAGEVLP